MSIYNFIECRESNSKTSGSLLKYYRDEPNDTLADSEWFISNVRIRGETPVDCNRKGIGRALLLKHLINFWRTLKMFFISPILTWLPTYIMTNSTGAITDTKLYIPVVTFSTQDNTKMLQQLKSYFKRAINRNKYHSQVLKK